MNAEVRTCDCYKKCSPSQRMLQRAAVPPRTISKVSHFFHRARNIFHFIYRGGKTRGAGVHPKTKDKFLPPANILQAVYTLTKTWIKRNVSDYKWEAWVGIQVVSTLVDLLLRTNQNISDSGHFLVGIVKMWTETYPFLARTGGSQRGHDAGFFECSK